MVADGNQCVATQSRHSCCSIQACCEVAPPHLSQTAALLRAAAAAAAVDAVLKHLKVCGTHAPLALVMRGFCYFLTFIVRRF